jgi:hypothetical protein
MTCTSPAHEATSLDEATDRALCWATHSLSQQGRPMLDAIWWLSTHLAASDRVLHRPLRRQREYRQAVAAQRRRARGLQWRLWELDRHVTGDGRLAGRSLAGLTGELRDAVRTYAECESLLLAAMTRHADDDALRRLADDYARAVRRPAPTPSRTACPWCGRSCCGSSPSSTTFVTPSTPGTSRCVRPGPRTLPTAGTTT